MTDDEIRQAAKDAGIKSWHVKSIDTLKAELEGPKEEAPALDIADAPVPVVPAKAEDGKRIMLVREYKDGSHYREWTLVKDVPERLAKGWIKAKV